ncbi:hypothetical protein CIB48_g7423, partial [Xylaria polymorpha]
SVIQNVADYKVLKCPEMSRPDPKRPWKEKWYTDHNAEWYNGFMQQYNVQCEADEFPPAAFWQGAERPKQYIRFSPGKQNSGAGSIFHLNFCGHDNQGNLPVERINERYVSDRVVGGLKRRVTQYKAQVTRRAVSIDFINVVDPDGVAGLQVNPCWPEVLLEDPGFALLTDDPYYQRHRDVQRYAKANYPGLIPQDVLMGHVAQQGYRKRDEKSHDLDPEAWLLDDGNSTRHATKDELMEDLGILRCDSADCHEEMQELGIESALVVEPQGTAHRLVPTAVASSTQLALDIKPTTSTAGEASAGSDALGLLGLPRPTGL